MQEHLAIVEEFLGAVVVFCLGRCKHRMNRKIFEITHSDQSVTAPALDALLPFPEHPEEVLGEGILCLALPLSGHTRLGTHPLFRVSVVVAFPSHLLCPVVRYHLSRLDKILVVVGGTFDSVVHSCRFLAHSCLGTHFLGFHSCPDIQHFPDHRHHCNPAAHNHCYPRSHSHLADRHHTVAGGGIGSEGNMIVGMLELEQVFVQQVHCMASGSYLVLGSTLDRKPCWCCCPGVSPDGASVDVCATSIRYDSLLASVKI